MHRYLYAYSNPTVYIDLYGYASFLEALRRFGQDVASLPGTIYNDPQMNKENIKRAGKGIADAIHIGSEQIGQLPDVIDQQTPISNSNIVNGFRTAAYTTSKLVLGVSTSALDLTDQTIQYGLDPTNSTKIPIVGPQARGVAESYYNAYENPTFLNLSQAVGQTAFGFVTALSGPLVGRGFKGSSTKTEITSEANPAGTANVPDKSVGAMVQSGTFEVGQTMPNGRVAGMGPGAAWEGELKASKSGIGPNDLKPREVTSPTKSEGGVYQFGIDDNIKTGSTNDFHTRYGGKNITTEYPQTRTGPAADHSAYTWTDRRQRRFDEQYLDDQVPADQCYRDPNYPKRPVAQEKWDKYKQIFGY